MQGFGADGYFQEYTVVEARGAMVLPPGIDLVEAGQFTTTSVLVIIINIAPQHPYSALA
jgi:hypothetical protein